MNNDIIGDKFEIPEEIEEIENLTFQGMQLGQGFRIPLNVSTIGDFAFKDAVFLYGFTLPSTVFEIGDSSFNGAHLPLGFKIPDSISDLGGFLYKWSSEKEEHFAFNNVVIPNGTKWSIVDAEGRPMPGSEVIKI